MKEERVNLNNVDADNLVNTTKQHFQEPHELFEDKDQFENYCTKAAKAENLLGTGSIRDVEVLVTSTNNSLELTRLTGDGIEILQFLYFLQAGFH